ncbi:MULTISPECIES: GntR family transcriptional regulator [Roseobacteraceae]|uniref:HTH-type transcriptional repressor RspR n=1 Tax=Pseudosulfitobacter pseudonitzschiae TaxID=1402135 RepID=A0A221K6Y0_9RHOB|nr:MULTISPECIES: GntR family transcriptional regulator [Roseobacteraceae]ASM74764.1 HTH-type transcriptional repressor RspR [Pseudosulfitobacter pseudonitzschiae]
MNESTKAHPSVSQTKAMQLLPKGIRGTDADMALFEGGPTGRGVYDSLRDQIVKLDLPPGTPLLRTELAETYGVSLTPLRDALQQLAKEGLVRIFPQSRTLVTPINITAIREAQFMRIALETEVVRELAREIAPDDLARLRSIVALQASIGQHPGDIPTFQELDEVFHQTLFIAARHVQTQRIMRSHAGHLERLRRLYLEDSDDAGRAANNQAVVDGHTAVLDGIAEGDAARAMDALRRHLKRTVDRIADKRAAFPEYFAPEKA